ncbi:ribonuclease P/MRP protein subunit POP1 KNAG_0F00910 [Huiozyma naganishii CBS 8797]|uniref:Uncharacterized protein n=1 Tax=Huiozyma naganishii (strain ATCC MYA-139 / BCRC 22969 / CBS 8797 / KCTC 17520 / NBRC 10181 / NCYC 3082 / Yp74L-3) TaxID=1071383 RepID=J7R7B8_HUIN7|nr:hypothetical protein KNAG_0F00910 [Kazachstania naganishii CBS 8797]CCK70760.1 hypothetical protein KNAG_0F00910 [Kazachstania naganishii CBS 8797]
MIRVDQFINSRQFEIKQLQFAMQSSKTASATRVFQALPRKLRRRTASHNVKRIPKRMRNRALREMQKNEQIQTVKKGSTTSNKLKKHNGLTPAKLYKAKMAVKLLRLASKSTSMKLALPNEAVASKYNLRQRIKSLQKLIKEARNNGPDVKTVNNSLGNYDNTGINALAPIPKGRIKYCKRQRTFTWLPTHIWNAKRSHMMKRWGFSIPWSPTQKCFKLTHNIGGKHATSDGALCMDTSFIGTMTIRDLDPSGSNLKNLVKAMTKGRGLLNKFFKSKNLFEGLMHDWDSEDKNIVIGPCDMLWLSGNSILLRLHPALYPIVFNKLIQSYTSKLSIEDCRYSIASITIRGAKALTALSSVVRSHATSQSFEQFMKIRKITDETVLPSKCMFAFEAIDPRHLASPKMINSQKCNKPLTVDEILALQNKFPQDEFNSVLSKLTTVEGRETSYKNQNTLKQLARRRRQLLTKEQPKTAVPFDKDQDPTIPLLIMRRPKNEDWVVLLPWFWHLPFWYQLNRISRVYHSGLRQTQQLAYESGKLYFPDDYPFTHEGEMENAVYKRQARKNKWVKKPLGKRINFAKLEDIHLSELPAISGEIGDYFSCDWKLLQIINNGVVYLKQSNEGTLPMICPNKTTQFDDCKGRMVNYFNDVLEVYKDIVANKFEINSTTQGPSIELSKNIDPIKNYSITTISEISEKPIPVTPIVCHLVRRGHPKDNARIYRIPETDTEYWMKVAKGVYKSDGRLDNDTEVPLPQISDLIGYITSGTYHFGEGKGVGNGFVTTVITDTLPQYVLLRNVGTNIYRLAKCTKIKL